MRRCKTNSRPARQVAQTLQLKSCQPTGEPPAASARRRERAPEKTAGLLKNQTLAAPLCSPKICSSFCHITRHLQQATVDTQVMWAFGAWITLPIPYKSLRTVVPHAKSAHACPLTHPYQSATVLPVCLSIGLLHAVMRWHAHLAGAAVPHQPCETAVGAKRLPLRMGPWHGDAPREAGEAISVCASVPRPWHGLRALPVLARSLLVCRSDQNSATAASHGHTSAQNSFHTRAAAS